MTGTQVTDSRLGGPKITENRWFEGKASRTARDIDYYFIQILCYKGMQHDWLTLQARTILNKLHVSRLFVLSTATRFPQPRTATSRQLQEQQLLILGRNSSQLQIAGRSNKAGKKVTAASAAMYLHWDEDASD